MASTASDARLEEFVERATRAASERAGRRLEWAPKDREGFWTYHCPLPGPEHDPHQWNGAPRARAKLCAGRLQAGCPKCTGGKFDDAYMAQVLEVIGWHDNVTEVEFGAAHSRRHLYVTCDDRYEVQHTKLTFTDRRKKPLWSWRILDRQAGVFAQFEPFTPSEFCAERYPELKHFYLALRLYGADHFQPGAAYPVVVIEGERDADTFNALMEAAGEAGWIATTLPIPTPKALSLHQRVVLADRDVVLIGDADEGGARFVAAWHAAIADIAASVRVLPPEALELSAPGKDLSDHIEQQENAGQSRAAIARRLLEKIAALPIAEPPVRTDWRQALAVTKSTGAARDSAANAKIVLTRHPDLTGRLRFNLRSGEVEITDAPWGDLIGAAEIARDVSIWLEEAEGVPLKSKSFEEALGSRTVAPPYDPLAELLATAWDGVPRLDGLFTRYLQLDLEAAQAVQLARLFMGDLVATLRNELVRQRVIVGIETDDELDVAGALLGRHSAQYHGGTVRERQLAVFARQQAALIQVGMATISDKQITRHSLPQMFAPFVQIGHRQISSPVFLALGERATDPRTAAKRDERCIALELRDHALEALAADAGQIIAEGMARAAELAATPLLARSHVMTTDQREARESARYALEIIWLFATRQIDPRAQHPPRSVETIRRMPPRPEVLRYVVRSQCLEVMRVMWLAAWRDVPAQEAAFNVACRALGWFKQGTKIEVTVAGAAAGQLGLPRGQSGRHKGPGVLLTDERLAQLEAFLLEGDPDDSDLPPFGGQPSELPPPAPTLPPGQIPRETAAAAMPREGMYTREENNCYKSRAHSYATLEGKPYLEGAAAIAAVRAILAQPGPCALDFETYPTAAGWHGDAAAAAAPRGKKGEARLRAQRTAELNGRAHLRRPCVLTLRHENGAEVVVRLAPGDDPAPRRAELQAMFAAPKAALVAHHAQFEVEVLLHHGVAVDIDCTQLMAKALLAVAYDKEQGGPPVAFTLAALVEREFGRVRDKSTRNRDWRLEEALDAEGLEYCLQDARDALELHKAYRARLEAEGLLDGYRLVQQAILPTAQINLVGMEFDGEAHRALTAHLRARAARLERILDEICGKAIHNHGSPKQVGDWIVDQVLAGDYADSDNRMGNFAARLCAVTGTTWKLTKNKASLSIAKGIKARQAKALEPYYPPVARYLRASGLRTQVEKLADSFGETLARWVDPDGRLRSQLGCGGTITLRHNAQHPPMQEMPRRKAFRRLFRAPEERVLVACDYDQIELRLAAIVAPDEALLEVYRQGVDVHGAVAANVNLPRSQAKPVSFTMIYGGGASKVAEAAGVSPERGQEVLADFLRAYPGIAAYRERAALEAKASGCVAIRPGRRVLYDPAVSKPAQAVNYPIQGGAASVQMLTLRRVHDALAAQPWLDTAVVAAVHDELLLESPAGERANIAAGILQHEMRQALLEVYPEALEMGGDRLAAAAICSSWAEKGWTESGSGRWVASSRN